MDIFDDDVLQTQEGMLALEGQDKFRNRDINSFLQKADYALLEDLWRNFAYDEEGSDSDWGLTVWRLHGN